MDSWYGIRSTFFESLNPASLDDACLEQVDALLHHIELNKPPLSILGIRDRIQFVAMKAIAEADGLVGLGTRMCDGDEGGRHVHIPNIPKPVLKRWGVINGL